MGHHGSVKCVDAMPGHDDILASAGRDGFLALWDTRLPGGPCRGLDWPAFLPVATVPGAHVVAQPRARQGNKRAAPAPTAVTALTFLPGGASASPTRRFSRRTASYPLPGLMHEACPEPAIQLEYPFTRRPALIRRRLAAGDRGL